MAEEAAKVFGKAIWLDNTRANRLCLRIGDDDRIPPAEDRLEPERMRKYRFIEEEGDGFRSYMGTCITLLLGQRPICLIDEPELCLHPPQAYALGRFIGKYGTSTERTTFVATHSSHVLRGIIEETKKLEIIRLTRNGSQFSGKKVSQEMILACIDKPATKVESILDGLFAEAVAVVESEADRLVYSTTWEKLRHDFRHDVHFVLVGGLGGMADTCQLYKKLMIPVGLVADLDLLRELGTFQSILTALASAEQTRDAMEKCRKIIQQIKALGPLRSEAEVAAALGEILGETLNWSDSDQLGRVRRTLGDLSAGLSETARLKQGLESLSDRAVYHDLKAFLGELRSLGVFLVPCGELEDWVPHLMDGAPSKKKKPERANFMANKIRAAPLGTDDIWAFIRKMAEYQRDEINRIGGYAL
jgi:AAA domain, putative AbiEii toxin, Type IV TA system